MKSRILATLTVLLLASSSFTFAAGGSTSSSNLEDVTGGKQVRGVSFSENISGYAQTAYSTNDFQLYVEFVNLPDPEGDDFYEGWLVQKSPFRFISTGKLKKQGGKYINEFSSTTDYTSYTEYILTLEPNDNDPAPADHILEGPVTLKERIMRKKDHIVTTGKRVFFELKNVSDTQALAPGVLVVHSADLDLDFLGKKIDPSFETLAEVGNPAAFAEYLKGKSGVSAVYTTDAPIHPNSATNILGHLPE